MLSQPNPITPLQSLLTRSNPTLVTGLLFVCAVLADNHTREHRSQFFNGSSKTPASGNIVARDDHQLVWAGARLQPGNESVLYGSSEAKFTVPYVWAHPESQGFSIFVGVGIGAACPRDQVQFSVGLNVPSADDFSAIQGWASWDVHVESPPNNFSIAVGDFIEVGVRVTSPTSGRYYLDNVSQNQSWEGTFNENGTVCQQTAEWAIAAFPDTIQADHGPPIPNFETVTFVNATATGSDGSIRMPGNATNITGIIYLYTLLTDVWVEESTMVINGDRSNYN